MDGLEQLTLLVEQATTRVVVLSLLAFQIAAVATIPSVLLRRRGRPTSALLWLVLLLTVPPVGIIGWWTIGRTRMERRLRKHNQKRRDFAEQRDPPPTERGTRFDGLLPRRAFEDYAFNSSANRVDLLCDGQHTFAEIERGLAEAERTVHLLFYAFEVDATGLRICDALVACRRRGVAVRLLLDGFGSAATISALEKLLTPHGVEVAVFLPTRFWPLTPRMNFVNHRKIITIDGRVGFLGGINIGEAYEKMWRDLMLRLEGPAIMGLNHVFLEDWYLSTQAALPDSPLEVSGSNETGIDTGLVSSGPDTEDWIHDAYFTAITQAKKRLYLSTPYFIPTQSIATALRTAAGRGVDVRIVLPSLSDVRLVMWASRSFYRPLLAAGVRIYEYGENMLHAKALVQDDDVCAVGSANIDNRSFKLNFEVSCFVADERVTTQLVDWLDRMFAASHELTVEECDEKPVWRKLVESAAHLASPLL